MVTAVGLGFNIVGEPNHSFRSKNIWELGAMLAANVLNGEPWEKDDSDGVKIMLEVVEEGRKGSPFPETDSAVGCV